MINNISGILNKTSHLNKKLVFIGQKVISNERISFEEGLYLYKNGDLPFLGILAHHVREKLNGNFAYYIKNIHIEYTNICINKCAFCSFRSKSDKDAFVMSANNIFSIIEKNISTGIKEVHIVGGIHPDNDIYFWLPILKEIKTRYPQLHIKAFTAAEIDFIITKAGLSLQKGLLLLKENGLDSIPGGGAEIFDKKIQKKIFPTKINGNRWLQIHRTAHKIGIFSNATMLYGHIESIENRLMHLDKLRNLQNKTHGFNAFIPLKYKNQNNDLKGLCETSMIEDLKMFAIARIYLDNIKHIKAYWPMLGKETAFLTLDFGSDDIDGTINNTTSIYSKAGSLEQQPQINEETIIELLKKHRKVALERDALYNHNVLNRN